MPLLMAAVAVLVLGLAAGCLAICALACVRMLDVTRTTAEALVRETSQQQRDALVRVLEFAGQQGITPARELAHETITALATPPASAVDPQAVAAMVLESLRPYLMTDSPDRIPDELDPFYGVGRTDFDPAVDTYWQDINNPTIPQPPPIDRPLFDSVAPGESLVPGIERDDPSWEQMLGTQMAYTAGTTGYE